MRTESVRKARESGHRDRHARPAAAAPLAAAAARGVDRSAAGGRARRHDPHGAARRRPAPRPGLPGGRGAGDRRGLPPGARRIAAAPAPRRRRGNRHRGGAVGVDGRTARGRGRARARRRSPSSTACCRRTSEPAPPRCEQRRCRSALRLQQASRSTPTTSSAWRRRAPTASEWSSPTATEVGGTATAGSSRSAWCRPAGAGTCSPMTSTGATGARSASTASRRCRAPGTASSSPTCPTCLTTLPPSWARRSRSRPTASRHGSGSPRQSARSPARVPPTVGTLEADGEDTILTVGADDLDLLAGHLVALGLPLEVLEPPELREHLVTLGRRLVRAHGRSARGQR